MAFLGDGIPNVARLADTGKYHAPTPSVDRVPSIAYVPT
jgi:hypothetical protein